jgi:hypothetical protein
MPDVRGRGKREKIMTPVLKLWLKQDPWHITTDAEDQNLILFMSEDGKMRNFIIPMIDILDWDLEYENDKKG